MKNEKKKKEVTLNIIIKLNYTDWECKKENILKKKSEKSKIIRKKASCYTNKTIIQKKEVLILGYKMGSTNRQNSSCCNETWRSTNGQRQKI